MKKALFVIFVVLLVGLFGSCDALLTTVFKTAKFSVAVGWNGEQGEASKSLSADDSVKYVFININKLSKAKGLSMSEQTVQWVTVDIDGQSNEWERGNDSIWTPNDPELSLGTHVMSVWEDGNLSYNEEFTLEAGVNVRFVVVPGGSLSGGIEWEDTTRPTLMNWGYGEDGSVILNLSEPMDESFTKPINYLLVNYNGETKEMTEVTGVTLVSSNNYETVTISGIPVNYSYLIIGYIEGMTAYAPTDKAGNLFSANDGSISQRIPLAGVSATSAEAFGNSMVELIFPTDVTIENKDLITLDAVASASRVWFPDSHENLGNRIRIAFPERMTLGAHTINFGNGAISKDGCLSTGCGYVVTVMADTTVPRLLSVYQSSDNSVIYAFSKAIDVDSGYFYTGSFQNQHHAYAVKPLSDTDVEVTWGSLPRGSSFFFAQVIDYSGNAISPLPSFKTCLIR